jgi:hypothetical protein
MNKQTTASTATSETSSSTSRATLASLVDTDGSAIEPDMISSWERILLSLNLLDVVHGSDSSLSVGLLAVTDEAETTAAASVTVLDNDLGERKRQYRFWRKG